MRPFEPVPKAYVKRVLEEIRNEEGFLDKFLLEKSSHVIEDHVLPKEPQLLDKAYGETCKASSFASKAAAEEAVKRCFFEGFDSFYHCYEKAAHAGKTSFKFTLDLKAPVYRGFLFRPADRKMREVYTSFVSIIIGLDRRFDEKLPFGVYICTAFPELDPPLFLREGGWQLKTSGRNLLEEIHEGQWYRNQEPFVRLFVDLVQAEDPMWEVRQNFSRYWIGSRISVLFSYRAVSAEIEIRKGPGELQITVRCSVAGRKEIYVLSEEKDVELLKRFRPGAWKEVQKIEAVIRTAKEN